LNRRHEVRVIASRRRSDPGPHVPQPPGSLRCARDDGGLDSI